MIKKQCPRGIFLLGFLLTTILLGVTFYLQNYAGFVPCPLCILQRITLGVLGVIFFLGVVLPGKKWGVIFFSVLGSVVSLIGIVLSGRQVWLQHFPSKHADCGASLQYLIQALPFDQVISKIMYGTAECSQKGWEFLHLSLAEWSLISFLGFLCICLFQIKRVKK